MRIRITAGLWFVLAFVILVLPLPWITALLLSSLVHELCHLVAAKLTKAHATELRIGSGGAYLVIDEITPFQELTCALAGPLGALLLLLLSRWMPRTAVCAAIQSIYNLLPLEPLDGGRALHGLTAYFGWPMWIVDVVERAAILGLVLGALLFLRSAFGVISLMVVFAILIRVFQEKYLAKRW